MAAPIRFLSGRQQQQKIGVTGSTEDKKVLEVVGRVGIGTTIFEPGVELDVRGNVNVSGALTATSISIADSGDLDIGGNLTVTGLSTFTEAADFNGDVDIDGHTELDNLNVSGISTFASDVDINASVDILEDLVVNNNLSVSGVTTLASSGGITTTGGDFYVGGDLYVLDDLVFDELSARNATLSGFTTTNDLRVTGFSTFVGVATFVGFGSDSAYFQKNVYITDDASLFIGRGHDLEILHDELNSIIQDRGTGDLQIATNGTGVVIKKYDSGEEIARFAPDDSVNLYYDGVSKFETAGTGVTVYGQTETQELLVTGLSTFSGLVDINGNAQINSLKVEDLTDNRIVIAGTGGEIEDDLNLTFDGSQLFVGVDLDVDGHTELDDVNVSGASTFTGTSTFTGNIDANGDIDVDGHTELDNLNVSGVSTFIGNISGTISTATKLETARNFSISGDILATTIAFDGTNNVAFAATIQPNSVALGTDTSGDYVRQISGTVNEIVVTGGTGESSTPVLSFATNPVIGGNVTIGNDLQVNNNLNVDGNITIGGTSAILFTETLKVSDSDIVLGFTTNYAGEDASNDTTANHGGIAVASTEGSPLVNLVVSGIETLPTTYKKIMWFKAGTFAGLGTDAWLSNYAIGIGSTQFPSGTRLAAGNVQISENDITQVGNINVTGVSTFAGNIEVGTGITFYANTGIISAVAFYGSGENLSDILQNKIEGFTATFESDPVGLAKTILGQELRIVSFEIYDKSTTGIISAVGFGSTAQYYFNPVTAVGLATDSSINITGIITSSAGFEATGGTFIGDGSGLTNVTAVAAGVTVTDNDSTVGTASILNFGPDIDVSPISAGVVTFSLNGEQDFSGIVTAASLYADDKIGINTTAPHGSTLLVNGDAWVSGVVTATKFFGDGTGLTGAGVTVADNSTDSIFFPTFVVDEGSAVGVSISKSNFVFNPSTSRLGIGSVIPSANLDVLGTAELDDVNVSGASTFASDVDINASVDISSNLTVDGISDLDELNVAGLSTFASDVDIDASVDILSNLTVDGISDLDELNVAGLSTFASDVDIDASVDILSNLNVTGLSTFASLVDANAGIDASTLKVEDLTENRIVIVGVDGQLEDDGNLTFDGTQLVIGAALTVTGVSTFASDLDINASIDVGGHTELDNLNVSGIATFQNDVFVGSGISMYASSGIVSAIAFHGDGSNLTGVTALSISTSTSSNAQSIAFVSAASTNIIGIADTQFTFIPSTSRMGIGTNSPQANLDVVGDVSVNYVTIGSTVVSLTTTDQTAIHTGLSTSIYRSVEYNIQVGQGTNFHATKIIALHDGTNAYSNEYGTVYNNNQVATFDVDVSGDNMRLLATGESASQTDYTISFTATKS